MPRSVVCISRVAEADGEEIGRLVADRLGFAFVDEEIVSRAAERGGIDAETVAEAELRQSPASAEGGGTAGSPEPSSGPVEVRELIRDAIREVAEQGNLVIVAHAASHAVGAGSNTLRVLVTASVETRSRRRAAATGVAVEDARRTIRRFDADRVDYFRRFYGVEELPTHYDLVVNTDTIPIEHAAHLIVEAATDRQSA